jgi:thiopeptide-type bacteriocin biosynthesis protein
MVRLSASEAEVALALRRKKPRLAAGLLNVAPDLTARTNALRHILTRLSMETYDPGKDRHGGPQDLNIAERGFEADSDPAQSALASRGSDPDPRWRFALLGMSMLLDDFKLAGEARRPVQPALTRAVPQGPLR